MDNKKFDAIKDAIISIFDTNNAWDTAERVCTAVLNDYAIRQGNIITLRKSKIVDTTDMYLKNDILCHNATPIPK